MKDPRAHVVPAGSPVTVHYNDGRPPNHTRLDFPFFFDVIRAIPSLVEKDMVAICDISKNVGAYIVHTDHIHLRETEAV